MTFKIVANNNRQGARFMVLPSRGTGALPVFFDDKDSANEYAEYMTGQHKETYRVWQAMTDFEPEKPPVTKRDLR